MKNYSLFVLTNLFLAVSACSVNPVTGKKQLVFMSEEQEIALGKQADPSIVAMYGLYQDQQLQNFINEKGQQMAKISHRPHLNYEFKILDSPVVNAFALPGGYIYFTRGILAHFSNEAEFAGVLGHEIGHVTARHGAIQQTQQTLGQILLIGGLIVSPAFRQFANEGMQAMQLLFLKNSRDHESQSDELGVEYSTEIGYDARHMANFFQTLNNMRTGTESETLPTFLSTHPDPLNRFQRVGELAEQAQAQHPGMTFEVNRDSYLQMIDGIIYGEDPKQGYVENNTFYHPELKFYFPIPNAWRTVNTPQQVQMAPKDGKALMILTLTQANSLEEAAQAIVEKYSLTVVEQKKLSLNGMDAYAMVADQTNQQTNESIRLLTYLISYNGLIYTFHGVSLPTDFEKYLPSFNQTMRNFKVLRDASKINVKPERISIKRLSKSGTFQSALEDYRIPSDRHRELALINGLDLKDQVSAGQYIKIVVK